MLLHYIAYWGKLRIEIVCYGINVGTREGVSEARPLV